MRFSAFFDTQSTDFLGSANEVNFVQYCDDDLTKKNILLWDVPK